MPILNKSDLKFSIILGATFLIVVVITLLKPEPVDWTVSFSKDDKIPYGSYILFTLLPDLFPDQEIQSSWLPSYNALEDSMLESTNYLIINKSFAPDPLDTRQLLKYVENGNTVFIAAQNFSRNFADTLGIKTGVELLESDSVQINFVNSSIRSTGDYVYKKGTVSFYFSEVDTSKTLVLGKTNEDKINYIKVPFGEGNLLLSTVPLAFTNYNLLFQNNIDYIFKALSYLPVQKTIWDEYYKVNRRLVNTPLKFILSKESLKWAYYVLLFTLIVFIIFESKRRQRIIPVIKPLSNTTLEFVETIGRLYYQSSDHKNLAEKKTAYFLESIRSKYYLKTNHINDDFLNALSEKSGIALEEVKGLFSKIERINQQDQISQGELIQLTRAIELFNHSSNVYSSDDSKSSDEY